MARHPGLEYRPGRTNKMLRWSMKRETVITIIEFLLFIVVGAFALILGLGIKSLPKK